MNLFSGAGAQENQNIIVRKSEGKVGFTEQLVQCNKRDPNHQTEVNVSLNVETLDLHALL